MRPDRLFRREVISARTDAWVGTIILQPPQIAWVFAVLSVLILVSFVFFVTLGSYTRRVRVEGRLVPSAGLITVTATAAGTISQVYVREGDPIGAGQVLAELSQEHSSVTLGATYDLIDAQLRLKQKELESDLNEITRLASLQTLDLKARLNLLERQADKLSQQIDIQSQRADANAARYELWRKWSEKGVISQLQLSQQFDETQQTRIQLEDLEAQRLQVHRQEQELRGNLEQLPIITAAKTRDTERALADVVRSKVENAAQSSSVLRASRDGIVTNIYIHAGQSLLPQQPVATILPRDSALLAELWLPTKDAGFIHSGDHVIIRYDAYPYQKFGTYSGLVKQISLSATSPRDVGNILGTQGQQSSFRVDVSLDIEDVAIGGRTVALRPGMTLSADILLERRRIFDWFLDPFHGNAPRPPRRVFTVL